ncbi:MAG: hypothetical protein WCT52_04380 [Candidatus Micrarchaeia archaeon]
MALARQRIGVVVVDMQEPNQCMRRTVMMEHQLYEALSRKKELTPGLKSEISLFLGSDQSRMEFYDKHKNACSVEKNRDCGGLVMLSVQDEAQYRAYANVCRLLSFANEMGMPIAILESYLKQPLLFTPTNNAILQAAGEVKPFVKRTVSGLSEPSYVEFVVKNMDTAVIAGHHMGTCVKQNAIELIKPLGLRVLTSRQVLSGYFLGNRMENARGARFYKNTAGIDFYRTLDELLVAIREKASLE